MTPLTAMPLQPVPGDASTGGGPSAECRNSLLSLFAGPRLKAAIRSSVGAAAGLILLTWLVATLVFARVFKKRIAADKTADRSITLLITGRMDSRNWSLAHLKPLVCAPVVHKVIAVLDGTTIDEPKLEQVAVPSWLKPLKPQAIARSLWALWIALRRKPDIIMAYGFFPAGLFSIIAARLTGAASVVQLTGGIEDIECGGIATDPPIVPEWLRLRLVPLCRRLCSAFDSVIVSGKRAESYVRAHATPKSIHIVSGSIDPARFSPDGQDRTIDVVFVGRLVPIKQPDHVIEIIRRIRERRPSVQVAVAGQGPLLEQMQRAAVQYGVHQNIRFLGHVEQVNELLIRSRVFLLTSRSEGLSIAMAEAMMAGAVPVVPDVGDLSELVHSGKTGWLVQPGNFDEYAGRICALLENEPEWQAMSASASSAARTMNGVDAMTGRWSTFLPEILQHR